MVNAGALINMSSFSTVQHSAILGDSVQCLSVQNEWKTCPDMLAHLQHTNYQLVGEQEAIFSRSLDRYFPQGLVKTETKRGVNIGHSNMTPNEWSCGHFSAGGINKLLSAYKSSQWISNVLMCQHCCAQKVCYCLTWAALRCLSIFLRC